MWKPNRRILAVAAGLLIGLWGLSAALNLSARTWGEKSEVKSPSPSTQANVEEAGSVDEDASVSATTQSLGDEDQAPVAPKEVSSTSGDELPNDLKELILNCTRGVQSLTGINGADEFKNLEEYLSKAVIPHGGREIERYVQYENVHVRSALGDVLRIHVRPSEFADLDESETMEIQVFSEDKEHLPVPMPLPSNLEGLPWQEAVQRFKTQGETVYEESAFAENWDEESGARIVRKNGRVSQMEVFFDRGALACSVAGPGQKTSCRCF